MHGARMKAAITNLLSVAGHFIMLPRRTEPWSQAVPFCVRTFLPESRRCWALHLSRFDTTWLTVRRNVACQDVTLSPLSRRDPVASGTDRMLRRFLDRFFFVAIGFGIAVSISRQESDK